MCAQNRLEESSRLYFLDVVAKYIPEAYTRSRLALLTRRSEIALF